MHYGRSRSALYRFFNSSVSHTATIITIHVINNILIAWVRVTVKKCGSLHYLTRLTVSALGNLLLHPCRLQRVLVVKTFYCINLFTIYERNRIRARTDGIAVKMNSTYTAHGYTAPELGTFKPKFIANYPHEGSI